jgi:ribosome biogenesis GTPase
VPNSGANSKTEFLSLFGWDGFFQNQLPNLDSLIPARVICEERSLYRVQWGIGQAMWAAIKGKMQYEAQSRVDYPAVGDWVLIEIPARSDRAVIHHICPRKTVIQRKQVGAASDVQILSANVDTIFITTSVNDDLNYRRIERYLAITWESGAVPVILLTKADICADKIAEVITDVQREFPGVDVHALSRDGFDKADFFTQYLAHGKTAVVIGSSGVGKSTLVNYLIASDQIKTQEIRDDDSKGRHTTTSRSLYLSRFGGLIIDTPGMRELQLSDHSEGVGAQFADIEGLKTRCRFSDCRHQSEPGCAIKEALSTGEISEERWRSYLKLEAEVRFEMRKHDKALASQDRKFWKKLTVEARSRGKTKRGDDER